MRRRLLAAALTLAGSATVGCAAPASTPPAVAPATPVAAASAPAKATPPQTLVERKRELLKAYLARQQPEAADNGVLTIKAARHVTSEPVQVAPQAIDLNSLPMASLPAPNEAVHAPSALPATRFKHTLAIEPTNRTHTGSHVYIVAKDPLTRLQVGDISVQHASERQYRACASRPPLASLAPARWMVLSKGLRGKPLLTVNDGWFDSSSCQVVQTGKVTVAPKPLLGGLMLGFRTRCAECQIKDWAIFLSPMASGNGVSGVGQGPSVSPGSFQIIRIPLRHGSAHSFEGTVNSHHLNVWTTQLGLTGFENGDAVLGLEIGQGVADQAPIAISYATILK